jgi:hypothetical protein
MRPNTSEELMEVVGAQQEKPIDFCLDITKTNGSCWWATRKTEQSDNMCG